MKLRTLASAIILTLPISNVFAENLTCKAFSGKVKMLTPDITCKIAQINKDYFPDLTFLGVVNPALAPYTCFTSEIFDANIGGVAVTGTTSSGITINSDPYGILLTAATAIVFKDAKGQKLGQFVTHDVITSHPTYGTMERLEQVDGTRLFKGGKGNMTLVGDAVHSATTITGTLCADD